MDNTALDLQDAVRMATEETVPQLDEAPQLNYSLPGGFLDDDGQVQTEVIVRELTGVDEEALEAPLKAAKKINPYYFTEQTVRRATERIGTTTTIDEDVVRRLLIGDRDFLVMAIRMATYGNIVEGTVRCVACGEESEIEIDISDEEDVPIRRLPDGNKRVFTVPLRAGKTAEVRLATADDQWVLGEDMNRSVAEMNTVLLSRCIISINGQPLFESASGATEIVRRLSSADRRTILTFLTDNQPGPQLREVKVPCAFCGVSMDAPIDLATLLRG